jgi:hypothetical protein
MALFAVSATADAQTIKLGEVMVFYVPDLKPDADLKAFEASVASQVAPAWMKHAPGLTLTAGLTASAKATASLAKALRAKAEGLPRHLEDELERQLHDTRIASRRDGPESC